MYGSDKLNSQFILRFGLTKEFFETFAPLKFKGIELPLTMMRPFHLFIKPIVDQYITDATFVEKLQLKHKLYYASDAQQALLRLPPQKDDKLKNKNRNGILFPGSMAEFAIDQFMDHSVFFISPTKKDKTSLRQFPLPKNFSGFNYERAIAKYRVSLRSTKILEKKADSILKKQSDHIVFGLPSFRKWLKLQIKKSSNLIYVLDAFLRKYPIGVIVNQTDIINPGTTLALLARKYDIPFIHVPENLNSDKSIIPTRAHYYCVWGKYYKNWLVKRGIRPGNIYRTGNLRFYYTKKQSDSMYPIDVKWLYRIPPNHMIATFTTQPMQYIDPNINKTILVWLKQATQHLPITVIIRPHPADRTNYSSFTSPKMILSDKSIPLYELLKNTDFLLTISSNTAIEATMFQKAIIILQPDIPYHYEYSNSDYHSHFVRTGAGPIVRKQEDLTKILTKMIGSKSYHQKVINLGQRLLLKTIEPGASPAIVAKIIKYHLRNH